MPTCGVMAWFGSARGASVCSGVGASVRPVAAATMCADGPALKRTCVPRRLMLETLWIGVVPRHTDATARDGSKCGLRRPS